MTHRYFLSPPLDAGIAAGAVVALAGDEAHHLLHVMRAKPGDAVTLFDGTGREFVAQLDDSRSREAVLTIDAVAHVDRELGVTLRLAVSLPKGDRQRWLVEKCTEIGVTELIPLVTTRSVAQPAESAVERLRRTVI